MKEKIDREIKRRLKDGRLSCRDAFSISEELNVTPAEIGEAADEMDIRLSECRLGLFGYMPEKKIVAAKEPSDEKIREAIYERLESGMLSCERAWEIAGIFKTPKIEISNACQGLGIKIIHCQLGAF